MRAIILLSLLSLSVCTELGLSDVDSQWEQFKIQFDRHYSTAEEELSRKQNFLKKVQYIESHNRQYAKGLVSHDLAVNQFSDWTEEEYQSLLGGKPSNLSSTATQAKIDPSVFAALPANFDWRSQNKVTPVKSQGQCGACWAFATVAIIEAAMLIKHNQMTSLSEQQLVDCNKENSGCNGGWADKALNYVQQNGLESEQEYPYHAKNENCANSASRSHVRITGHQQLRHMASDDEIMAAIQTNGPLAVNIDASGDDFGHYKSGILSTGTKNLNHYVTVIGWGPNYWIVKNSWGTTWGMSGFGYMAKGINIRGFNNFLFYPTV